MRDAVTLRGGFGGSELSLRLKVKPLLVTVTLSLAAALAGVVSLLTRASGVSASQMLGALTARGIPEAELALDLIGPRIVCGLLAGIAFGVGGAILQSIARNPLASPDVIGVSQGASLVAVIAFSTGLVTQAEISLGALAGGLLAGGLVYALAWRDGLSGDRLVLVGIGLAAALAAVTSLVLIRADVDVVARIAIWLTGSLAFVDWPQALALTLAVAVLLPLALALARIFPTLALGDEMTVALGWRLERRRGALVLIAIAATAMATSVCGPIVFVALLAPQLGRLLAGTAYPTIGPSAATGALLVVVADLIGSELLGPRPLPVGVVTAAVGAPFMLWLLRREARREP